MVDAVRGRAPAKPGVLGPEVHGAEALRLQHYGRAWRQALDASRRLVHEFGAARVVAVGDLVHPDRFGRWSSIQLVVWGLRADVFWRARVGAREASVQTAIHDGDELEARLAALVREEGIELARTEAG